MSAGCNYCRRVYQLRTSFLLRGVSVIPCGELAYDPINHPLVCSISCSCEEELHDCGHDFFGVRQKLISSRANCSELIPVEPYS